MATADSIKTKIQNLIATANETTGNTDTDLTSAVGSLIEGYGQGGTDSYYDAFWDAFQDYGNRTDYLSVFNGKYWTNETFKPKHSMHLTSGYQMFKDSILNLDFADLEEELGIVFDFSKATTCTYMLMFARGITGLNVFDTRSIDGLHYAFGYAYGLKRIKKLILRDDGSQTLDGVFLLCYALEEITSIEGVIGKSISFTDASKLNEATISLVISKLSDTATGMTASFSKTAVTNAFGSTESAELLALINSKPNWTISIV